MSGIYGSQSGGSSLPSSSGVTPGGELITDLDGNVVWFDPRTMFKIYDDVIGYNGESQTNWRLVSSGTNRARTNGTTAVGNIAFESGSGTNNKCLSKCDFDGYGQFNIGDYRFRQDLLIKMNQLSDGTDTYTFRCGLTDDRDGTANANSVFFSYTHSANSGNFQINSISSTTATTQNTATAMNTNWTLYTIEANAAGTEISFFVNGTEVSNSPLTTNIPSAPVSPFLNCTKTAGTANIIMYFDYYYCFGQYATTRVNS